MVSTDPVRPKQPGHVSAKPFPCSVYTKAVDISIAMMGGKVIPGVKLHGLKPTWIKDQGQEQSCFEPWLLNMALEDMRHDRRV